MKYDEVMLETAELWASQSYCERRKVGCVIAKDGRIVSIGYNGTLPGTPNECEEQYTTCPNCGRKHGVDEYKSNPIGIGKYMIKCECGTELHADNNFLSTLPLVTNNLTMHAEQNALSFCTKNGISTNGCTIYITTSPCEQCSKLLAASGIERVVYRDEYKITKGLDMLRSLDIEVTHLPGE